MDITVKNYNNLYVSRKFWIPNATVMDLNQ
jgi:hypothetical protein